MKKFLLKHFKPALGLILALALPSCLQNETTITLNKDGSGTIVDETVLGAQMMQMMTQFAQPGQPDPIEEMFAEKKAKEKAAKMGEGVEYVKTEMFEVDGKKGAKVHYKFADINKVQVNPSDAVNNMDSDGAPEPEEAEDKDKDMVKFAYKDGELKIITPPADFKDMSMDEAAENPQQEAMMMQMMADMRLTVNLKIADGIEKTNASHVTGDTITIFDVQVGKMFGQKEQLKEISKTAETDIDAAKAAFNKLDGIKVETNENVTVKLK